jgi:hypothetical protein
MGAAATEGHNASDKLVNVSGTTMQAALGACRLRAEPQEGRQGPNHQGESRHANVLPFAHSAETLGAEQSIKRAAKDSSHLPFQGAKKRTPGQIVLELPGVLSSSAPIGLRCLPGAAGNSCRGGMKRTPSSSQ